MRATLLPLAIILISTYILKHKTGRSLCIYVEKYEIII